MPTINRTMTTAEAAKALGVVPERVQVLCRNGQLKATLKEESRGAVWVIDAESVKARIASKPGKGRPRIISNNL